MFLQPIEISGELCGKTATSDVKDTIFSGYLVYAWISSNYSSCGSIIFRGLPLGRLIGISIETSSLLSTFATIESDLSSLLLAITLLCAMIYASTFALCLISFSLNLISRMRSFSY